MPSLLTTDPGACSNDGEVQLVNGTIEQEGRVEICLNGVWGAICETGWSTSDAYVMCKGIGYSGQSMLAKTTPSHITVCSI